MGFEEPKPLSIDEIAAGLADGSIERGNHGTERIVTSDGTEIIFNTEHRTIKFEVDQIGVEIALESDNIRLSELVSDKTVYNQELEAKARNLATKWLSEGLFD